MLEDKVAKAPLLPIIGTEPFNLTPRDVDIARREAQDRVEKLRKNLNHPDESVRKHSKKFLPDLERQLQNTWQPSETLLLQARTIYDRTLSLASSGLNEEQLGEELGDEFPNITDLFPLLASSYWGFELEKAVLQVRAEKQRGDKK